MEVSHTTFYNIFIKPSDNTGETHDIIIDLSYKSKKGYSQVFYSSVANKQIIKHKSVIVSFVIKIAEIKNRKRRNNFYACIVYCRVQPGKLRSTYFNKLSLINNFIILCFKHNKKKEDLKNKKTKFRA